jgi:hypothetical protein
MLRLFQVLDEDNTGLLHAKRCVCCTSGASSMQLWYCQPMPALMSCLPHTDTRHAAQPDSAHNDRFEKAVLCLGLGLEEGEVRALLLDFGVDVAVDLVDYEVRRRAAWGPSPAQRSTEACIPLSLTLLRPCSLLQGLLYERQDPERADGQDPGPAGPALDQADAAHQPGHEGG